MVHVLVKPASHKLWFRLAKTLGRLPCIAWTGVDSQRSRGAIPVSKRSPLQPSPQRELPPDQARRAAKEGARDLEFEKSLGTQSLYSMSYRTLPQGRLREPVYWCFERCAGRFRRRVRGLPEDSGGPSPRGYYPATGRPKPEARQSAPAGSVARWGHALDRRVSSWHFSRR